MLRSSKLLEDPWWLVVLLHAVSSTRRRTTANGQRPTYGDCFDVGTPYTPAHLRTYSIMYMYVHDINAWNTKVYVGLRRKRRSAFAPGLGAEGNATSAEARCVFLLFYPRVLMLQIACLM